MDVLISFTNSLADISLNGNDLTADHGLQTSVIASLFSDRRADVSPDGAGLRGWWPDKPTDRFGSLLWLVGREKVTEQTAERIKDYAASALKWLIDEGIAAGVQVETRIMSRHQISFSVAVSRGANQRYEHLWRGISAMRVASSSGNSFMLTAQYGISFIMDTSSQDIRIT